MTFNKTTCKNFFIKNHSDYAHKYSGVDIKKMIDFLIEIVSFGNRVIQQSVGTAIGYQLRPIVNIPLFVFI